MMSVLAETDTVKIHKVTDLDGLGGKMLLADHLIACLVQHLDGIGMGRHLRLKGLVLLDLSLRLVDKQVNKRLKTYTGSDYYINQQLL